MAYAPNRRRRLKTTTTTTTKASTTPTLCISFSNYVPCFVQFSLLLFLALLHQNAVVALTTTSTTTCFRQYNLGRYDYTCRRLFFKSWEWYQRDITATTIPPATAIATSPATAYSSAKTKPRFFSGALQSSHINDYDSSVDDNDNENKGSDDDDEDDEDDKLASTQFCLHLDLDALLCHIIQDDNQQNNNCKSKNPLLQAIQKELSSVSWQDAIMESSVSTIPDCVPAKVQAFRRFCTSRFDSDICHDGRFTVFGSSSSSSTTTHSRNDRGGVDATTRTSTNDVNDFASLHPDIVFSMDNPLEYLRDVLSCPSDPKYPKSQETVVVLPGGPNTPHQRPVCDKDDDKNNKDSKGFIPTSPELVEYYSKVLGGIGLAQLHCGSQIDQGDIILSDPKQIAKVEGWLMEHGLLEKDSEIYGGTKPIVLDAWYRDFLTLITKNTHFDSAAAANNYDYDDDGESISSNDGMTFLERSIFKLIDAVVNEAVRSDNDKNMGNKLHDASPHHLVLLAISGASQHVASAIEYWKQWKPIQTQISRNKDDNYKKNDTTNKKSNFWSTARIEEILHRTVTVVTIGSICHSFPIGPAYLHLSLSDDPLSSLFSRHAHTADDEDIENTERDEMYGNNDQSILVQAYSPYIPACTINNNDDSTCNGYYTLEAHNLAACGIQWLALLLRVNGTRSFRTLYDLASTKIDSDVPSKLFAVASQSSEMHIPPNLEEELLPAMIRATKGHDWLWKQKQMLSNNDDDDYDDDDDVDVILPSEEEAAAILEWQFGYDSYDEIATICTDKLCYDECELR